MTALDELNRVCKDGEMLIIPTYMNKDSKGKTSGFAGAVGNALLSLHFWVTNPLLSGRSGVRVTSRTLMDRD